MVRLAQIGVGYWGKNLLRNFYEAEGAEVAMLCDRDARVLARLKQKYKGAHCTDRADEIFNNNKLDAIAIATPAGSHFELAKAALQAGKHTFVEKPLALSARECEELIQLADGARLVLMVGHTFLFDPAVRRIKEYLREGLAGEIYYINSRRLNFGLVRGDVDALWNFAPHDLSILMYWLEEKPVSVAARGYAYLQSNLVDVVFLHLHFASGVSAHVHVSWLDPNKVRQMTIVGAQKMIVYDDVHPDRKVQIFDKGLSKQNLSAHLGAFDSFGNFQLMRRPGDLLIPKIDSFEPLKAQCQHFVDCIREHKRPLSDGANGLAVVRVLEAARESMLHEGKSVQLIS